MPDEAQWILFGPESEVRQKGLVGRTINGHEIAVAAAGERIAAIQRRCPHEGASLDEGQVFAAKAIKCPLHGFIFDLFTGKGLNCPAFHIATYETKIENGEVFVKIGKDKH
ncbi:MAG TPA: Rieske 2Fe-2S domain-containing protein [Candidatus Binatia bacterium]|jgi:nitrite reductase/ring-hydroxylating ferredoxin subunit